MLKRRQRTDVIILDDIPNTRATWSQYARPFAGLAPISGEPLIRSNAP